MDELELQESQNMSMSNMSDFNRSAYVHVNKLDQSRSSFDNITPPVRRSRLRTQALSGINQERDDLSQS